MLQHDLQQGFLGGLQPQQLRVPGCHLVRCSVICKKAEELDVVVVVMARHTKTKLQVGLRGAWVLGSWHCAAWWVSKYGLPVSRQWVCMEGAQRFRTRVSCGVLKGILGFLWFLWGLPFEGRYT